MDIYMYLDINWGLNSCIVVKFFISFEMNFFFIVEVFQERVKYEFFVDQ